MMSMSVTMHPIWQSGAFILVAGVATALIMQILVQRLLPAEVRRAHTELGAAIFAVIGTTYAVLLAFMATTAWEQRGPGSGPPRGRFDRQHLPHELPRRRTHRIGNAINDLMAYLAHIIDIEWPAQIAGRTVPATEPLLVHLDRTVLGMTPNGESQSNIQRFLIGALSDVAMTAALVASGVLVLLLIVGLSSPFHGTVTITPNAYAGVLTEMREAP
jgi:hypothetical protein